jgi:predicted DNA-binding transcriptional regulator YafY
MSDQEILAFRLMKKFLKPLLPHSFYQALLPYFDAAQEQLDRMPRWVSLRNWETKVRIIPAAQPLLPPEPPPSINTENARHDWQQQQEKIRTAILEALFDNRQCQIEYQQIWRDKPETWILHPLAYLQRGQAFYLLCTINNFTDVRQLALHRMVSATVLDAKANKPDDFNIDREVERSQGMGGSGEPLQLVARFWKRAGLHLMETRLSTDQTISEDPDNSALLRITATVKDTAQLRWWLLSFGQSVEVLQPDALRAEMATHAYYMYRKYSRTKPEPPTDD